MPRPTAARPRYQGARYLYACDNQFSTDRYGIFISDGTALVWVGGQHSAWSDDDAPVPHLCGDRVAWSRLPTEIKKEVHRRCDELDSYLRPTKGWRRCTRSVRPSNVLARRLVRRAETRQDAP